MVNQTVLVGMVNPSRSLQQKQPAPYDHNTFFRSSDWVSVFSCFKYIALWLLEKALYVFGWCCVEYFLFSSFFFLDTLLMGEGIWTLYTTVENTK